MNRRTLIATALAALTAAFAAGLSPQEIRPFPATAATFKIDSVHSTALFRVHHLGAGMFYGPFNDVRGTFTFTEGSDSDLAFDVVIPIESVDTNNESLDRHLKSPDFFNVREHPEMSFKSTSARRVDARTYEVAGTLTIRGTSRPVTAKVTWTGAAQVSARMGYRCGFETTFTVNRGDFGVSYGIDNGMLGEETRITVSLEGIKQE